MTGTTYHVRESSLSGGFWTVFGSDHSVDSIHSGLGGQDKAETRCKELNDRTRHDRLRIGDPCPNAGGPFDGYSWTGARAFDTCRLCCREGDPMAQGLAPSLQKIEKRRESAQVSRGIGPK